jgi:sec-independent protein translocase protein TatA
VFENLLTPVHLAVLFVILVFLFGAKKLPELGKGIGSGLREFKNSLSELGGGSADGEPKAVVATPPAPTLLATPVEGPTPTPTESVAVPVDGDTPQRSAS